MEKPTKLFNRNFMLLWQGQAISRLGSQGFSIAMLLWTKDITGSASLMGLLVMLSSIPGIILGPFGGTFADLYSRRKIILISDLLRGLSLILFTAAIFFYPEAEQALLVSLFIVAVFNATLGSFFGPAISASIPELVPKESVAGANSLGQLSTQLSVFIGQGLGGTFYRILGAPALFLVNGLSFMYAALSDSFVRIPQVIPEKRKTTREQVKIFTEDLKQGFFYVYQRAGLRETVLVSAIISFFMAPLAILLPFYVEDYLRVPVDWYGYILAAFGVGTLFGYIIAGVIRLSPRVRGQVVLLFIIVQAVGYGLFAFVRNPTLAILLALLDGFLSGYVTVNITTILQVTTPGEIRGRVFGILATISTSLTPIAIGLAGVVADLVDQNIPLVYFGSGLIMTILVLILSLNPQFRAFLASDGDVQPVSPLAEEVSA